MHFKVSAGALLALLIVGSVSGLPTVNSTSPADGSSVENKVKFQFTPDCSSSCSSASLNFNTTGNLTFEWRTDSWESGDMKNVESSDGNLTLEKPGEIGVLNYEWYKTGSYYDSNGHPSTESGLDEFFDSSNSGVSLGGTGTFESRIHWHDSVWDEKPGYLPAEDYSWKATGYLYAPTSGTYTIGIDSDDSADVIIDGTNVASWYSGHGIENGYSHSGDITLDKGGHKITVRMEEGFGNDGVSLAWKKPGDSSFSIIPKENFANDSIKYRESGSFETDPKRVGNPVKWTNFSKKASIPSNTGLDADFATKEAGGWDYYDNLSDVPETKNIKVNLSLSTQENYSSPEIDSMTLEYRTEANADFNWIKDTETEFQNGDTSLTEIKDNGKVELKRNATGPEGNLRYTWFDTSGLNERNNYASNEDQMDDFFDTDVSGVSLGGEGTHSGEVHWWTNGWNSKPAYLPESDFSWKAEGYLYAPTSGTYSIGVDSDDASDIFVDGTKVASFYGGHGTSGDYSNNGDISLSSGYHKVKVRMQEHTGGDGVSIAWQKPGDSSFTVIPSDRLYPKVYQDSGNYTSEVFEAMNEVKWKSSEVEASVPTGTSLDLDYATNNSGTWVYEDSIEDVPESRYLKYRAEMDTGDSQKTPSIDKVNLTYSNSETFFREMKSTASVTDESTNNLEYDFSSYNLPSTFKWNIEVEDSDGDTNTTENKAVTVEEKSFPKPEIEWYEPEEGDSNETPINFRFEPTCYSEYGCYEVGVLFNSTGERGSWIFDSEEEWSENGTARETVFDGGTLRLEGKVGSQGSLEYSWYDTEGLNENNGYADSESDMDNFFDTDVSGVSLGGEGTHSNEVHWWTGGWNAKPSYLPGDQYSWKAEGYLYAPTTGTYTIGIDSDDGSDIIIDGENVASYYGAHGTAGEYSHNGDISLSSGYHTIKVRMQENAGQDGVSIAWQKPGDSSFTVIPSDRFYMKETEASGNYTSDILTIDRKVDLVDVNVEKDVPSGAELDINYLENSTGTWESHDDIEDFPQAKYSQIEVKMSASDESPEISRFNLTYEDREVFKKRLSEEEVYNNTEGEIASEFLDYSLPQAFKAELSVKQSNGQKSRTSSRTFNIKFSGIKAKISWEDQSENEIGYRIYTNASGTWRKVGEADRNSEQYVDRNPNLEDGEYACYKVRSFNSAGESPPLRGCATFTEN